jgi:HlyD family secretion protein
LRLKVDSVMNVEQGFWGKRADVAAADVEPLDETDAPQRRRRILIGAAIAGIVLIAAALLWLRSGDAPAEAPALPRVTVIVPGRQPVTSAVTATGSLAARREMPVGVTGEGGMVARVLVDAGDRVQAGQTLAVIERSVQTQQAGSLAASVTVARADAALAEADLKRAQALVERGFVSKADIDRRVATRDAAVARVRVAEAQLREANARIGLLDIRAPAAGLVLTRGVEPGQVVSPASGTLFRIARAGEMEMQAVMAEEDLARLAIGSPAEVTPTGSTKSFAGRVWQLSPVIDPQTRQGMARIALPADPAIRPGGFASVRIISGTVDAPLLPESAVLSDEKGNFVYVVGAKDRVVRRAVTTGAVSPKGIAILSGLNGSEQVVLSAGAFLNPGDPVAPVRAPAAR